MDVARYVVTAKCQDLAERGYVLRYEGEIVELPDDASVPKWFRRVDGPAGEAASVVENPPAPVTPDVVTETLLGTSIPGTPTLINPKRPPGRPRKTPVGL